MNNNQKLATLAALGLFVLTIVFAPWQKVRRSSGHIMSTETEYAFILAPPDATGGKETRLATSSLLAAWLTIGLLYAATLKVFAVKSEATPEQHRFEVYRFGFWAMVLLLCIAGFCKWFYY